MAWTDAQIELNKLEQKQTAAAKPSAMSYGEGLMSSAGGTLGEMVGVEKPPQTQKWEAEHPYAAFGTELATWAVPLGLWGKVSGKVIRAGTKALEKTSPKIAKTIDGIMAGEKLLESPFKAGLAREMVRFAPFEAGRVAAGAAFGEALAEQTGGRYIGTGQLAQEALVETALFGIGAGGFEKFASAGKKTLGKLYPGADLSAAPQIQLRQMAKSIEDGKVFDPQEAMARMREHARDIRAAYPEKGKYVTDMEFGYGRTMKTISRELNRLLKPKRTEGINRLSFGQSVTGNTFRNQIERSEIERRAGLFDGYEAYVQHPRYIQALTRENVRHTDKMLQRNMQGLDTGNGWFFNKDKADGLFLMGRKLGKGEWVLFKTDSPGKFVPEYGKYVEQMQKRMGVFGGPPKYTKLTDEGADIYNLAHSMNETIPAMDMRGTDLRRGGMAKVVGAMAERSGVSGQLEKGGEAFQGLANFTSKYFAPTMMQSKHPMFNKVFGIAKATMDAADGVAEAIFMGKRGLKAESGSLWREIIGGAVSKGGDDGLQGMIGRLHKNPGQWEAVWKTVNTQSGIERGIKEFGLEKEGIAFLRKLEELDKWQVSGLNAVQSAAGESLLRAKENHFMISRTWNGDWRVPVKSGKKVIGYASGKNRAGALQEADEIIAEAAKAGERLTKDGPSMVGELQQDLINLRNISEEGAHAFGHFKDVAWLAKNAPKRATERRTGAIGYVGGVRPWTKEELEKIIFKQLQDYQKLQAKISIDTIFKNDLDKLAMSDPGTYEQLMNRLNQINGVQGKISRAINEASDVVFGSTLGKNSASKIVAATNKFMFRWTLGFANVGYNMANMLTFVQTAYPQIAFLTTAAPEAISRYYTYWPVAGTKHVDGLGVLDIFKLTKQSFKALGNPDPLLRKHFERGAMEGVWDPRFVEEYVGKTATQTKFGSVLRGEEPFSEWFGSIADALPSASEKFARAQAFSMGHTLFRDVFRVTDEEMLYQMTKQFVEKTQFMYGTADRANIITGPMGSAAGLFKNWVMHYIGWMSEYTGEAVMRGNWKPLLYQMGGTGAIGGLGALPLYGAADSVSKWLSDESLMQHTYNQFGAGSDGLGSVSDSVFYGLPAMAGFSLQNQVSAPGVDFGQDAARLFSLAYLDRMKYAGQAFGSAVDYWGATGQNPVQDQGTRDKMMRAFAPKMLYRTSQSLQENALKSLGTGYKVTELDTMGRILYAAGVNPLTVERTYATSQELWADQEKRFAKVKNYGTQWAQMAAAGDGKAITNLINRAVLEGVDVSSMIKSGKVRLAKGKEDMIERNFSPESIFPYRQAGIVK
jgi:hypothetical protein